MRERKAKADEVEKKKRRNEDLVSERGPCCFFFVRMPLLFRASMELALEAARSPDRVARVPSTAASEMRVR